MWTDIVVVSLISKPVRWHHRIMISFSYKNEWKLSNADFDIIIYQYASEVQQECLQNNMQFHNISIFELQQQKRNTKKKHTTKMPSNKEWKKAHTKEEPGLIDLCYASRWRNNSTKNKMHVNEMSGFVCSCALQYTFRCVLLTCTITYSYVYSSFFVFAQALITKHSVVSYAPRWIHNLFPFQSPNCSITEKSKLPWFD